MANRVLVVEDSKTYLNYLKNQLIQMNIDVVLAKNYAEATNILNKDTDFLCAILDYCLPDAEHGEVIDFALNKKLKVIVLTANFNENTRETILAKGVVDYILKENMASVSYLLPLLKRLSQNRFHKALIVDDSKAIRVHLAQLLDQQYIRSIQAADGAEAIEKIEQNPDITLVIADHHMPNKDGITMTREIRRNYSRSKITILGLSGTESKSLTARFLKAGANDYLKKPFNEEEFLCRIRNMLDMKDSNDEMYKLANQDALTGLWNRRYLFSHVDTSKEQCNVAMMDIDHFKKINDTYGHDGGDQALKMISHIITIYFKEDLTARIGGEEFCIVNYGNYDDFVKRLENMRARIEKTPAPYNSTDISMTISIGCTKAKRNIDTMMSIADDRLYQAKTSGRNRVVSK